MFIRILERKIPNDKSKVMFICIGTKENKADSIGPLIGSYLKIFLDKNMVLGDLKNNIVDRKDIYRYSSILEGKYLVAIDTAIDENVIPGEVFINENPIIMGKAIKKNKGCIGNLGIKITLPSLNFENDIYIHDLSFNIAKKIFSVF